MGIYNTEYFKKRAQDIHYDKFDYSEAIYINSTTKINIICKIHGCFAQTPSNHFKYGCNKCGYEQSSLKQKSNIEIFIRESNVIHNLKFDYSESIYVNEKTKIIIICPFHGRFEQCPVYHKQGQGCPKCGKISSKNKLCKKHNVFIKESELIQKIKYDYSETVYINSHSKVTIICPIHGKFDQLAKSHINGVGCPKCFGTPLSTKEEFIIKANKIHEYKYNYEHVFYTGNKIKVIIVCPNHGEFLQKPNSHLTGQGCPMCKESKGEQTIRKFFLENSIIFKRQYKIKDCKNIRTLPFDFAILKNNKLYCLIEYQGEQHYRPFAFGSKNKDLSNTRYNSIVKNDLIKSTYCKNNNIPFLAIPYTKLDNLDNILKSFILSLE